MPIFRKRIEYIKNIFNSPSGVGWEEGGAWPQPTDLLDDVVEEDDLRELHGEVVLVGARLEVADDRGADAERGHQQARQQEVGGMARLGVHQQQGDVLGGDPLQQLEDHQRAHVLLGMGGGGGGRETAGQYLER